MRWMELAGVAIGAASSIYAGNKAASAGKNAAAQAGAVSDKQYQQTREDMAPGRQLYGYAANELGSLYGFGDRQANALAQFGRGGDTEVAHLTPGETVVPERVANQPEVQNWLAKGFQKAGLDPNQYTVGGPNSVNPDTGMREFRDPGYGGGPGSGSDGWGGGGENRGGPEFDAKKAVMNPLGYGITSAARHMFSPNPDGSYGYTPEGGYSRQDGGDRRQGQNGGYGGYGGGTATAGGMVNGMAPMGYDTQENAMARFYQSPDYRINFDEGAKTLERSAAARGGLFGGNTATALVRYGQDYGNRLYNQYANRLQSFAGLGQTAAAQTGQFGAGNAANQGNALMAGGAARAQGWENIGNSINAGVGNALYYNYMN